MIRVDDETKEQLDDYTEEELESIDSDVANYDIAVFYNTFNLTVLLDQLEDEELIIPDFQRSFVWNQKKASEFIDSLLRNLPIPAFFFYEDTINNKLLVVDGQQRLNSLYSFIRTGEFHGSPFKLSGNVHKEWLNKSFEELDRSLQKKLQRTLLNCTTMRQMTPDDEYSSMYLVFQRINTGGVSLKAQEIRMSLSHGKLSKWLSELSEKFLIKDWVFLRLKKEREQENYSKIQELIVRMLALYLKSDSYSGNMRRFIDDFFQQNRNFDIEGKKTDTLYSKEQLEEIVNVVLEDIKDLPEQTFTLKLQPSIAFFESVWIGLIHRKLELKKKINRSNLENFINAWKTYGDPEYKEKFNNAFPRQTTTGKETVISRINLAKEYFAQDF
ncbi:MAG: DUF262 domain-containing protein [Brevinema sp.]